MTLPDNYFFPITDKPTMQTIFLGSYWYMGLWRKINGGHRFGTGE
jgi:hypothetical protein